MKFFTKIFFFIALTFWQVAYADTPNIGVVLMHGKGGSPTKHVVDLAHALERSGYLVANIEMPWSGRREYDVDVSSAEREVELAIDELHQKGANKVFVSGHSLGGLFALYYGSKHDTVSGIIAIAPGGNVNSPIFREKLADSIEIARTLIAEGKGNTKASLTDFEGSKGTYPLVTTPASYVTWFDPDGAMNQVTAMKNISKKTPVLYIAPTNDYPGSVRSKDAMFGLLTKVPRTELFEPNASHMNAPTASAMKVVEWISQVAVD